MRVDGWPRELHAAIEGAQGEPFAWGTHDCCTFASRCVLAVTGRRLWPEGLGRYSTEMGAQRALKRLGWADVAAAFDDVVGPRRRPLLASRGDVVVVQEGPRPAAAVVDLTGEFAVGVSPTGLFRLPIVMATASWCID